MEPSQARKLGRKTVEGSRAQPVSRKRNASRTWIWLVAIGVLLIAGALLLAMRNASGSSGTITAKSVTHDFGQVRIGGGLISAKFPLTVEGSPLVTSLETS